MNNMLTLEEVKDYLEVDQHSIEKFIRQEKLRAYRIGGEYLRFRKEDVLNLQQEILPAGKLRKPSQTFFSRVSDFWRFNNIYLLAVILLVLLTFFVVQE